MTSVELVRPRPRLVHVFPGGQIVVVDDVHPVAWLLAADGSCERQLSWVEQAQPPRDQLVGPFRRSFTISEEVILVHDVGVARTIELSLASTGAVRWAVGPENSSGEGTARRSIIRKDFLARSSTWTVRSRVDGHRRSVEVAASSRGTISTWIVRPASALSGAAFEDGLLVALRPADKRPWEFDPPRRLVWFTGTSGPRTWDLPPVEHPWEPYDVRLDDDALLTATGHSLRDLQAAADQLGATMPEVSVTRPTGRMPLVNATFSMPDGRRLRWANEPYDVLGNWTGGLVGLSIWLEEEIVGGLRSGVVSGDRL